MHLGVIFSFFLTNKLHITSLWQPTSFNHCSDSTLRRVLHQRFPTSSKATYKIGCMASADFKCLTSAHAKTGYWDKSLPLNGGAAAAAGGLHYPH